MSARGLIISPSFNDEKGRIVGREGFDPAYLRQCILFWDILECPDEGSGARSEVALLENKKDLDLLASEGRFTRTRGYFFFKRPGENVTMGVRHEYPEAFWAVAQLYAYQKHKADEVHWSLGGIPAIFNRNANIPGPEKFYFVESGVLPPDQTTNVTSVSPERFNALDSLQEKGIAIELNLYESMLAPSGDVPMGGVLDFREKRWPELLAFRHAVDGLASGILKSEDIPRATEYAVDKVQLALLDLNKVMMAQPKWKRFLSNLKVKLALTPTSVVMGAILGQTVIHMPLVGALLGGIGSSINVEMNLSTLKPMEIPEDHRDYAYLYHIKDELVT